MKKLQQGRSMIEMLGVLAIIGVLSIGGLAGYTMAMNRHKANNILDFASRCAVIAQTKGMGNETFDGTTTCISLTGETDEPTGLTGATVSGGGSDNITITLTYATGTDNVAKAVEARSNSQVTITGNGTSLEFKNK